MKRVSAKRVRPLRFLLLLFAVVSGLHLVRLRSALDDSRLAAPPPTVPGSLLTVATGANSPFFAAMKNLVGSTLFWCQDCPIAVFNLGLSAEELAAAAGWCRTTVHWAEGYAHGDPNTYAFKAAAVAEAVEAYGTVLWLDGGSTVTGWLKPAVLPLLLADGHFLVQGQDTGMVRWVHPSMFAHFGVPAAFFGTNYSFSGNTVGFVRGAPAHKAILLPWLACAHNASCIAPPGSSKANHRYDQAALSVLALTSGLTITPHTELLAAERSQLQPCEQPSAHVVWTSRSGESCYAKYSHRGCIS